MTIAEAARTLGITERTVRRRISEGRIDSEMVGGKRVVVVDQDPMTSTSTDMEMIKILRADKERLINQVKQLQDEVSQVRERSDTIILQLTGQNQQLLQYHRQPWYRRWLTRKGDTE